MSNTADEDYGKAAPPTSAVAADIAPALDYMPHDPVNYRPAIALIGCGGITAHHLSAYRSAGYNVVALCDMQESRARERQASYFPQATVYTDYQDVLRRPDIEVVDLATHPLERAPLIEAALLARKHVLSQKPFVLDLDFGGRMAALADRQGVKLAVNQNGRWAPHFAYLRAAVAAGLLGDLTSANLSVHWDHTWVLNTPFNDIHDLLLYDFAIHWFDIVNCFFGGAQAGRVSASTARTANQKTKPPMLGHVLIEYPGAQATLGFDATVIHGQLDRTLLSGSAGSASSIGSSLSEQKVTLHTASGASSPQLQGTWFPTGFHGTMGELLCAIEQDREPTNSARNNLDSLALAFAAIASAHDDGNPKKPGAIRTLPVIRP